MIKNPSFEGITRPGGWTRDTHTSQEYGEIFTPEGFVTWWEEGDYRRPEVKVIPKQVPFLDPLRIYDRSWGVQAFTFYGRMHAGLYQVVTGLTPGKQYELSAYAHAWSTHTGMPHMNDPHCSAGVGCGHVYIPEGEAPDLNGDPVNDAIGNFLFRVGVSFDSPDPFSGVTWGDGAHIYNGFHQTPKLQFAAPANGQVVIYLKAKSLWTFRTSDAYWDKVELKLIDAPTPYESTMLVLPQDATPTQLQEVFTLAYPNRRTFGFSHDDAGHLNGTAILYNIPSDEKQAYLNFYTTHYPDVTVKFKYTSDWGEDDILLWQCDSKWRDKKYANTCSICNLGCWVTDCAMAQRYYSIDKDATPITVDELLKSVGGYSGCDTTWAGMKAVLGIEVVKKTTYIQEALQWLKDGNVCFAEVLPTSLEHFVMVDTPDYHMYDPYENKSCNLYDLYEGAESWRLIRQVQSPSPPLSGSPIGLHLQSMVDGALEYIARVKPRAVKIFQLENAKAIKAANPDTLVVLRYFTSNQNTSGDLKKRAKEYVDSFKDSLITNAEWIDYVESYNELIATHDIDGIKRSVEFDCCFADALMDLGLPVAPLLLTAAVGNPYHKDGEVELLLPAVRKVIQYNGVVGYHGYWYATPDEGGPDADWKYYAGRWCEWDKVFSAHGLYPRYILGESGAVGAIRHPDGSLQLLPCDGWRSNMCCKGDWNRYKQQLHRMAELMNGWNTTHNNRAIGYTIFTTGGWDWKSFEFLKEQMQDIT